MTAEQDNKPVRLELTMQSGAKVDVDVSNWEVIKGSDGISRLKWETPASAPRKLISVKLDEIAALVEIRQPEAGQ
jgi:hypothetical protein